MYHRWEGCSHLDLNQKGWEGVDWNYVLQIRDQWQGSWEHSKKNLQVPYEKQNFITSSATASFALKKSYFSIWQYLQFNVAGQPHCFLHFQWLNSSLPLTSHISLLPASIPVYYLIIYFLLPIHFCLQSWTFSTYRENLKSFILFLVQGYNINQ